MKFKKIMAGCALVALSYGVTEAVDVTVKAKVPFFFSLNALVPDKNEVNLLDANGREPGEADRTITFTPTLTGQAKVKVSSANGQGNDCRVHCDGAAVQDIRYTVQIKNGAMLQHDVASAALDFQAGREFKLVFDTDANAFNESGKEYSDTLTVTFEAP